MSEEAAYKLRTVFMQSVVLNSQTTPSHAATAALWFPQGLRLEFQPGRLVAISELFPCRNRFWSATTSCGGVEKLCVGHGAEAAAATTEIWFQEPNGGANENNNNNNTNPKTKRAIQAIIQQQQQQPTASTHKQTTPNQTKPHQK
jgi:hypothetical protein